MNGEPYAGADPRSDIVYVQWGDYGDVVVLSPGGTISGQLSPPPVTMVPLLASDPVDRDEIIGILADVRLSKRIRTELAEALDVEADAIGKRT